MSKTVYHVMFDNGNAVTFESDWNVDFNKISITDSGAGLLAFDDTLINLQHVAFIDKEAKNEQTYE